MHIIIPMRRVPDTETKVGVSGGAIDEGSFKSWIVNPYDEYAIEEALRLIEGRDAGKITMVAIGQEEAQETVRKALAMGADEAVMIQDEALTGLDPLGEARVLAAAIEKIGDYDLVWTGWKAVDDDLGQVGIMLAEFLDLPLVSNVITVTEVGDGHVVARAEGEGGYRTLRVPTPALLTESQGPNEPRYPSLRGIMGAKKKPMTIWSAADLGIDPAALEPRLELLSVDKPPARGAGRILEGEPAEATRELVRLLREEARVL